MMRSFLDTNVLVYLFDAGAPEKKGRAQALLQQEVAAKRGCRRLRGRRSPFALLMLVDTRCSGLVLAATSEWRRLGREVREDGRPTGKIG
jgi:hypothetical protein